MHSLEKLFVYKTLLEDTPIPMCGIQFKNVICGRPWTLYTDGVEVSIWSSARSDRKMARIV